MTNPSKVKGSQFERDVVEYARAHGFIHAERRFGAGAKLDRGDIEGVLPGAVIEAKNHARLALSEWMDELAVEIDNAHAREGFLVVKRRRASVGASYVVQTLAQFCERERDDAMDPTR